MTDGDMAVYYDYHDRLIEVVIVTMRPRRPRVRHAAQDGLRDPRVFSVDISLLSTSQDAFKQARLQARLRELRSRIHVAMGQTDIATAALRYVDPEWLAAVEEWASKYPNKYPEAR